MKKIFALTAIILASTFSYAQEEKFEVTYTSRLILPADFSFQAPGGGGGRQMPKEIQDEIKKNLQEPQESILTILGDESIYKAVEKWTENITINEALKKLNDKEKMIINKRFFNGRTQMEVNF